MCWQPCTRRAATPLRQRHSVPDKPYFAAVLLIVNAHLAYLIYVPSGGFLALRWPRTLVLHVLAVVWAVAVVCFRLPCPSTYLEQWARAQANMDPLPATGFIDRYVAGVLYPSGRTRVAQASAFFAAGLSWVVFASRRGRRPNQRL